MAATMGAGTVTHVISGSHFGDFIKQVTYQHVILTLTLQNRNHYDPFL